MAERCLRDLLENDDYLSKVLRCLVDDGLHECSRVCRRWREVSFDVCPKLARVPSSRMTGRMTEMLSKYPNTVSMAVNVEDTNGDIGLSDIDHYLDAVKRFPKIEHLFLQGSLQCSLFPECPATAACLNRLQSLSVWLSSSDANPQTWIAPALRHLTNLTHLRLKAPEVVFLEPVTEIHKIGKLCLSSSLLVDHKGDLVFPALTNLTCLELIREKSLPSPKQYEDRMSGRLLEVNLYS